MNINSTFLIQIINFFIVYYMLRKLLFFPVLKYIYREQEKTKEIFSAITKLSHIILVHEKNRQNQLIALKKYFVLIQPPMLPATVKLMCLEYNVQGPTQHDIDEFSKKLEMLLQEKVLRDIL